MISKLLQRFTLCTLILLMAGPAWAAHPLFTDDSGTLGKGKFLLEVNGQYDFDKDDRNGATVKSDGGQMAAALTYGIIDQVDLALTAPYVWGVTKENDVTVYNEKGIGDVTFDVKWRFFEKDKFSLALKPGLTFPTGDSEKSLGAGRVGGHLFLIASQELGSLAFHGNLGYIRNENKNDEHYDIWHASLAVTWEAVRKLKLVANAGIERNRDESTSDNPAFFIGGVIYSVTENFDVDFGAKYGLTRSDSDFSLMAGLAFRF